MIKMNEERVNKAILTLEVLIDECKEDGTYYNAQKEWEALEVFKKLQKQNAELIKTKNEALSYIQNYNHMNLRYQDAETKDKLNLIKNILNGREDYQDKVQNNWNELKKWVIEQEQKAWDEVSSTFGYVLDKMQELEQEKDE